MASLRREDEVQHDLSVSCHNLITRRQRATFTSHVDQRRKQQVRSGVQRQRSELSRGGGAADGTPTKIVNNKGRAAGETRTPLPLHKAIQKARTEKKVSQKDLAAKLNGDRGLRDWEGGPERADHGDDREGAGRHVAKAHEDGGGEGRRGRRSEEESARGMKFGVYNVAVGSQRHLEGRLNIVSSGRLIYHIGIYEWKVC